MESAKSAETFVTYYQPTQCYISEELIRHENAVITLNCTQMLRFPPLCICQQYRKSYSCNKMSVWLSGFLLKARRTQPRDRILTAAQGFNSRRQQTVAYSGILFGGRGVVQQIQLRTEDRYNWDLGAVAPYSGVLEAAVLWYKKFHFIQ